MGLLHGHRRSRPAHADRGTRYYPTMRLLRDGVDDAPTRYEPQTLAPRAADPYEEWRAKREAEQERSQADAVRWVYRQRGAAANPHGEQDAAAEAVRWVNRYSGVGAEPTGRETSSASAVGRSGERERPVDLIGAQGG